MKAYTDITILLDRSGSMNTIKEAMEEGFNKFIKEHKVNPTTRVSLVQFDTTNDYEVVYQSVPVNSVEPLRLVPRGGTPLLDSLCQTIDKLGNRYAGLHESERPDQVLLVIITDGEENSSRIYKRKDVFNRITKQTNDYKWNFLYLGANQDAIQEAATFGIPSWNAMGYTHSRLGATNSWKGATSNTVAYASTSGQSRGTQAAADLLKWSDEQRKKAQDDDKS